MSTETSGQPDGQLAQQAAAESPVMDLLSERVPLSLIIDLSAPAGPDSEKILDDEGQPEDAWWEPIA